MQKKQKKQQETTRDNKYYNILRLSHKSKAKQLEIQPHLESLISITHDDV